MRFTNETIVVEKDAQGKEKKTVKVTFLGTGIFEKRKAGWKYTDTTQGGDEDTTEDVEYHDEVEGYSIRYWRLIRKIRGLHRQQMSVADTYGPDMTPEQIVALAQDTAEKRMEKVTATVDIEWEARYSNITIGRGSAKNGITERLDDVEEAERLAKTIDTFSTPLHRRDVFEVMNGLGIRQFNRNEATGALIEPTTMGRFEQDGIYIRVKSLVFTKVKEFSFKGGKKTVTEEYKMIKRDSYEPSGALLDYADEFISVFIGSPLMKDMGDKPESYRETLRKVKEYMKEHSVFKYFIVGRKNRLVFSKKPFGATQITRDFMRVALNRAEHLGQLLTARGIKAVGKIKTPEVHNLIVPDGVVMLLTSEEGMKLGLTPGVWQIRSVAPYSKGTIVVMDQVARQFLNSDAIKVKPEKVNGVVQWPTEIHGENIIAIANSDKAYDMRFSHQFGYTFIENFIKAEGKIRPWGRFPELMAALVPTIDEERIEEEHRFTLPTEYSHLRALGLPYEYFRRPEELEKVIVRAARPVYSKLSMFVALPIQFLDRKYFTKVGMYMAAEGEDDQGRYMLRIPALAVNGAVQDLYHEDANGEPIIALDAMGEEIGSPLVNVHIAAIYEPTVSKDRNGNEVLSFEDDVENGGDGRSRIIWSMLAAMGADSDGDRIGRTFKRKAQPQNPTIIAPIDQMLEQAGMKCTFDVPLLKTKNEYPDVKHWVYEPQANEEAEESEHREQLWAVSTPVLGDVGKGDVLTQDSEDLVFAGHMKWNIWQMQAKGGANIVQRGVSAPKYFMPLTYQVKFNQKEVQNQMERYGVGRGYDEEGILYDLARERVSEEIVKFFPPLAELRTLVATHPGKKWEGGMASFRQHLLLFDEQMGDNWMVHVRNRFKHELARMVTHNIKDRHEANKKIHEFGRDFKSGAARHLVRKYIAQFINEHPDKPQMWAWMLTEEFVRPEFSTDRRPDGMPLTAPELVGGQGRILEIMGLPFDMERLKGKEEKARIAEEKRKERKG